MKRILIVFLSLFLLTIPLIASAQVSPVYVVCKILEVIQTIILAVGLGIAVIILVIGGITYMTAGGDAEKANKARKMLINGVIGIAIVFAAAFLLGLVQGILLDAGLGPWIFTNPCDQYRGL